MTPPAAGRELAVAWAAAEQAGVTRLADLTGLDRFGVPVFQAVRPASRALSVHQGKGLSQGQAKLGALMEAVESHWAEQCPPGPEAAFDELPPQERAPAPDDFATARGEGPRPDERMRWVEGRRVLDGDRAWAPFDFVSLDFRHDGHPGVERISTGLAARFDRDEAVATGLFEALERDADFTWRREPMALRAGKTADLRSIPYPWFRDLAAALEADGVRLAVYAFPSIIGAPVVAADLIETAALPGAKALAGGSACAATAEAALLGAVLEALQSRLTLIAGARDDVLYDPVGQGVALGSACPLPAGLPARRWDAVERAGEGFTDLSPTDLCARLAAKGYPDAAVFDLGPAQGAIAVVKVVVPGLAGERRRRRQAALAA